MQAGSHKLLFLGLSGLMSVACFYGSQTGPTLLVGNDAMPAAESVVFTPQHERARVDRTDEGPFAAKLTTDGACSGAASEVSQPCLAASKINLSTP